MAILPLKRQQPRAPTLRGDAGPLGRDLLIGRINKIVGNAIRAPASDPRPAGCKNLTGGTDYYRIRVGDYRVLYEVRDRDVLVLLIKIGHRREVYR
jgi:mRNA interferase RelE/StbE